MEKLTQETERIMTERFGKDTVIALATTEDGIPHVRYVNAFYEDGAFYIITYALSGKMKQLEKSGRGDRRRLVYGAWNGNQSGIFRKRREPEPCRKAEKGLCRLD